MLAYIDLTLASISLYLLAYYERFRAPTSVDMLLYETLMDLVKTNHDTF